MASGSVWVLPWRLPANIRVAPNSPSARAQDIAAAAISPGRASGSTIRKNARAGEAPRLRATTSSV